LRAPTRGRYRFVKARCAMSDTLQTTIARLSERLDALKERL
jgi:hypothetical protein